MQMSALFLNRDSFSLPEDGWYQLAPLGEFVHGASKVMQVVDATACEAMVARFEEDAEKSNFAGLLIDFDHFSLDAGSKSEAAGWITALEARSGESEKLKAESGKASGQEGLWAKIRWSDLGEDAVKGGRYRFLSPVWSREDCEELGDNRVRPVRLLNAAVTNDPNLKGMVPLSNSRGAAVAGRSEMGDGSWGQSERRTSNPDHHKGAGKRPTSNVEGAWVDDLLRNAAGAKRLKWVLGNSPEDRHCPSCVKLSGQVHTAAEWSAAGISPKHSGLYCQGHCHCKLVETGDALSGSLAGVPLRKEEPGANAGARGRDSGGRGRVTGNGNRVTGDGSQVTGNGALMKNKQYSEDVAMILENIGWTDEARDASLAVRQAKAAKRDGDDSAKPGKGKKTPDLEDIREKLKDGEALTDEEADHLDKMAEDGYAGESDGDPVFEWMEKRSMSKAPDAEADLPVPDRPKVDREDPEGDLIKKYEAGEKLSPEDEDLAKSLKELRDGGNDQSSSGKTLPDQKEVDDVLRKAKEKKEKGEALSIREQVLLDVLGNRGGGLPPSLQVAADKRELRNRKAGNGSRGTGVGNRGSRFG